MKRAMTPATGGMLRHITWQCAEVDGQMTMIASLVQFGGVMVALPISGEYDHDDLLVLTDRITRFFFVIHGEHLIREVAP